MIAVPLTLKQANIVVTQLHRHHRPVVGHRFSVGAMVESKIVGAIIIGRPVARNCDQTYTFEVTRLVTDGTKNVCSFLYARAARAAEAMGAKRIQTYTLPSEGGGSLRAAGWTLEAVTSPTTAGWNSRTHRDDAPLFGIKADTVGGDKTRWARTFGGAL
jgi:hypothetical protein